MGGLFGFGVVFVCVWGKTSGAVFTRIRPYASAPRQAPVPESEATSSAARAAPAKKKRDERRRGRAGKRQPGGETPAPPRAALPARRCGRGGSALPQLARGGRDARRDDGRMISGCQQDARRAPPVLPGCARPQPRSDADPALVPPPPLRGWEGPHQPSGCRGRGAGVS